MAFVINESIVINRVRSRIDIQVGCSACVFFGAPESSLAPVLLLAATCFAFKWQQRLEYLRWDAGGTVCTERRSHPGFPSYCLNASFPSTELSKAVLSLSSNRVVAVGIDNLLAQRLPHLV